MPACSPRWTSDSANGSAQAKITAAANTSKMPTTVRRCAGGRVAIIFAGPTRCGSSAGARAIRITNTTKMPTRIAASMRVSVRLSGRVSE